jgi:RNA polymerase sigma-70 factor (ECF subfamily)
VTRKRRELPLDPEEMQRSDDRMAPSVEQTVLASELVATLDRAIAQLSDPLRATFTLRDIEGLSTGEVAEILEVSESAVKMRLARAREALRVLLKEYL